MTAPELLTELHERGVMVWAEGPWLEWSGPPGAMTEGLRRELGEHKDELLGQVTRLPAVRRLDIKSVNDIDLFVIDLPTYERQWELRRGEEVLLRTHVEDHETARAWIAALQAGQVPM